MKSEAPKSSPQPNESQPAESQQRKVDATSQIRDDPTQPMKTSSTTEMTRPFGGDAVADSSEPGSSREEVSPVEVSQEWDSVAFEATEVSTPEDDGIPSSDQGPSAGTSATASDIEQPTTADKRAAVDGTVAEEKATEAVVAMDQTRDFNRGGDEPSSDGKIPKRLGGFKLDRQLGKGGMGTVFLATQLSLDREVAIKILKPELTENPSFVSRFVREAYAAAQLVHHNVVQIYDIGSQGNVHYFSMELVKGDSLAGLLKRQRRLDCDTAAGYILQAARGLKFAHDQGMVHRDVKPANLMIDEHGIVKVADLGLVKIGDDSADEGVADQLNVGTHHKDGDSQITQFGVSVGTPTYMAPEQWKKSSEVDQRADIYSLGCTFYVLVTGKLPFDGKTPKEVVTKVITEQAVPPELLVKDIPKRISTIVNQMLAKDPKDRYPDMGKLISDLEEYLGISSSGAFSPSERHVEILEKCVNDYNNQPLAKLRKTILQGGLGLALLLFLGAVFFSPRFAMGVIGTLMTTGVSYFTIRGLFEKTHLFSRTRDYLFSNQLGDWLTMGVTAIVGVVLAIFVLGITGSLIAVILGPLLGLGLYFGIDKVLSVKRKPAVEEAEKLFKVLRLRGLNEDLLRQFVCRFSGNNWEEFFEELFGYPAKMNARNWLKGETGKSRKTFRWWRDPLVRWVDKRFDARDQLRQIRHLEKVEMQKLVAQGIDKAEAKVRARNIAKLMTENAEAWRQSQSQIRAQSTQVQDQTIADTGKQPRPTLSNLSRNLDEKLKNRGPKVTMADRFHGTVSFFIGPRLRFLVGVILFGLSLWWMQANGKVAALSGAGFMDAVEIIFSQNAYAEDGTVSETRPIPLPLVPTALLAPLNSINHGVMGLVFIFSATIWGWLVTIPVVLGGFVALFGGSLGVLPENGIMMLTQQNLALAIGVVIAVVGCFFMKPKTEEPL